MWSFSKFARNNIVPAHITHITSEAKEKGEICWNQMIFTAKRQLSQKEAEDTISKISDTKLAIQAEKGNYQITEKKSDVELDNYGNEAME